MGEAGNSGVNSGTMIYRTLLLSVGLPLLLGTLLVSLFPEWKLSHYPIHAMVEGVGAFAALTIAILMVIMIRLDHLSTHYIWAATALIGMGILDGFHAILQSDNTFVWLHSLATLVGGTIFAAIWSPASWRTPRRQQQLLYLVTISSVLLSVGSLLFQESLPLMVENGLFTRLSKLINFIGGFGFLLAASYFIYQFRRGGGMRSAQEYQNGSLVFANHCLLFGVAAVLFESSVLWDAGWWGWHLIRLLAYLTVLVYLFILFKEDHGRLRKQAVSLQEANDAIHAMDGFLSTMSHKLRTPLTSIIGNSELLAERESDQEQQELIQAIEVASRCQLALVNDILDMYKMESGKFVIDEAPFELSTLLAEIEQMFSLSARNAGLALVVEQKNRERYPLMGDQHRMRQVLINLIGNAIKFTLHGRVTVVSEVRGDELIVAVKDTGIGISPEAIKKLFQHFEEENRSISHHFDGSGMRLFISSRLATMMGGRIEISSTEGVGSEIRLILPYRPAEPSLRQPGMRATVHESSLIGHVLIAEDTPELRLLVSRILQGMGVTVTTVNNGKEALELATRDPFDLILMDIQMPVMNGVEATAALRAEGIQIPIVALTANVMPKHRDAFNAAGGSGFLTKPIDKKNLRAVLAEYLNVE